MAVNLMFDFPMERSARLVAMGLASSSSTSEICNLCGCLLTFLRIVELNLQQNAFVSDAAHLKTIKPTAIRIKIELVVLLRSLEHIAFRMASPANNLCRLVNANTVALT
jgi:hypothetical protein